MKSQKNIWDGAHKKGLVKDNNSGFAGEVSKLLNINSNILELGCGVGADAAFFAKGAHQVIATDFSKTAIERNIKNYKNIPGLKFKVLDMEKEFEFSDSEFDLVYARLSLHYFTDFVTRKIFSEIRRVLKPGGILAFICKSPDDPLYGKGDKIEKDMFEADHVRHFFSEEYVKDLLSSGFEIKEIEKGEDVFYSKRSAFIKVIAKKM